MDSGRRRFLTGAFLTREGRERAARSQRPLGPPPPTLPLAVPEPDACEGCAPHPCVGACGEAILRLHPEGHRLAGIPYVDFQAGGCTFCGDCIDVCPLAPPAVEARAGRLGTLSLDQESCVAWRGVVCLSCDTACQYRAIEQEAGLRPRLRAGLCTGCGQCVSVCPAGALSVPAPA